MIWFFLLILSSGVLTARIKVKDNAVDISDKQNNPNLYLAAHNGIDIVIHRATEGSYVEDVMYEERYPTAKAAGVKFWGAYHFADNSDGMVQAAHFLGIAREADFYALYLEFIGENTVNLEEAEAFVTTITGLTERKPFIVASSIFLDKFGNSSTIASCPLWVVDWWGTEPAVPKIWKDDGWVIWQHTNGEVGLPPFTAPGIGNCHRNIVNMTKFLKIMNSYGDYQLIYKAITIKKRDVRLTHEEQYKHVPPSMYEEISLHKGNVTSSHKEEEDRVLTEPVIVTLETNEKSKQAKIDRYEFPPEGLGTNPLKQEVTQEKEVKSAHHAPIPVNSVNAKLKPSLLKKQVPSVKEVKSRHATSPFNGKWVIPRKSTYRDPPPIS